MFKASSYIRIKKQISCLDIKNVKAIEYVRKIKVKLLAMVALSKCQAIFLVFLH